MSRHAKKMKRIAEWEGSYPEIGVSEAWLYWDYCVVLNERRVQIRVEVLLEEEDAPWLYVDGDPLIPGNELTWEGAEVRYGAKTRLELLKTHRAAIRANEAEGLAALRKAATATGHYGQLEGQVR